MSERTETHREDVKAHVDTRREELVSSESEALRRSFRHFHWNRCNHRKSPAPMNDAGLI